MGYRGKVAEKERARELRADGKTLLEIAAELGVSKGSVSVWVRDVPFTPSKRRYGPRLRPNALQVRKQAEIDAGLQLGSDVVGAISDREFLVAGAALYAGEGAKRDGMVVFANSDPRMVQFFLAWLRKFFEVDESRLRLRMYLHEGLDFEKATAFWESETGIPRTQHMAPYRAAADSSMRLTKHIYGCPRVVYSCARTHRLVMGLVHALLTCDVLPG